MIPIESLESDMGQITESVFITMLGMEVSRAPDIDIRDLLRATRAVSDSN